MKTSVASAFICGFILIAPLSAGAAPATVQVGSSQATLQFTPDPPQVGKNHAVVTLSGAPADQIAQTSASFRTVMPSMSMNGPHGNAQQTGPGRWEFDATIGMAAPWDIRVRFAGGISGTALYHVSVGTVSKAPGVAGMSSSSGNPDAWRIAIFALVVIFVIGLIAVLRVRAERRPLTLGLAIGAAVLTVILAIVQARYSSPPMDMAAMASVRGEAPIPVTAAAVRSMQAGADVFAPGSIAPYLTQDIVTRQAGILRNFSTYAGDRVRSGQVIASLDAPDLQTRAQAAAADASAQAAAAQAAQIEAQQHAPNAVVIAQAQTQAMQSDLAAGQADQTAKAEQMRYWQNEIGREKTLLDQGAVSQQEYQDERAQAAAAIAAFESARLRVASLKEQLTATQTKALDAIASVGQMRAQAASAEAQAARARSTAQTEATLAGFTTIASPSDAIVIKRLVDPGVYVQAGTAIARIAVVDRLRVQANVAQRDLAGISLGTPIEATLWDGTIVRGRVTSVSPVADLATHTAAVEAIVTNARTDLVPGGYVRVSFRARSARVAGGFSVPSASIVGSGSDCAVWVISAEKTAHRVPIRVANDDGTNATVSGALNRTARVIVEGAPTLEEGQSIVEERS